jgi:hypothetical protein
MLFLLGAHPWPPDEPGFDQIISLRGLLLVRRQASMSLTLALSIAAGLFFGMLIFFDLGRRIGIARLVSNSDGMETGSGPVEAAVFGLLGLLLAFTFSGAASRFEERRHLIAEEANAIGTAYFRIDLLPRDAQPEMRGLYRRYVDTRVQTYRNVGDVTATQARLSETATLQKQIWAKAILASQDPEASVPSTMLLLPATNAMFDMTTTRAVATQNHPPMVIFVLLAGLSLVSALLAGNVMCATKTRSRLYMVIFAATVSITVYVILDLEFPRLGLIRVDAADQVLIELRKSMN